MLQNEERAAAATTAQGSVVGVLANNGSNHNLHSGGPFVNFCVLHGIDPRSLFPSLRGGVLIDRATRVNLSALTLRKEALS